MRRSIRPWLFRLYPTARIVLDEEKISASSGKTVHRIVARKVLGVPFHRGLNPDEYLNGNLKNKVPSGTPIRNRGDLEKKTRSFMRTRIRQPAHVRSYFKHPKIVYVA